jgi:retron-type reverse transcriptase
MRPKAYGKQRPLGIIAIEDRIVMVMVVVAILTPIYEAATAEKLLGGLSVLSQYLF